MAVEVVIFFGYPIAIVDRIMEVYEGKIIFSIFCL